MFMRIKLHVVWLCLGGFLIQSNVAAGGNNNNNHKQLRFRHCWRKFCHRHPIFDCVKRLRGGAAGKTTEDEELDAYIEFLLAEYAVDESDVDGGFGEDHLPADEDFSWGEISYDFDNNDFETDGYTSSSNHLDELPMHCQEESQESLRQGDLFDDDFYARLQNLQKALHFNPDYESNIQEPTDDDALDLNDEDMEDSLLAASESILSTEKEYPFSIESSDPESTDSDGSFDDEFPVSSHYSAPSQQPASIPYNSPPTSSPTTDNVYTDDEEQENNILCRVVEKTIKEKMHKDIQEIDSYINQLVENHDLDQYIDELLNHDLSDGTEATDNFDEAAAAASLLLNTNAMIRDQAQGVSKATADLDRYIDKVVEEQDLDEYIEELVHDMPEIVDDEKKTEVTSSVAAQEESIAVEQEIIDIPNNEEVAASPVADDSIVVEQEIIEIEEEIHAGVVETDKAEVASTDAATIIDSVHEEGESETVQMKELSSEPSELVSADADNGEDPEILDAAISIHTETPAEQLVEESTDQVQSVGSEVSTSTLVNVENELSATSDVPPKPKKKRIKKSRKVAAKGQTADMEWNKEEKEVPSMVDDTLPSVEAPEDKNETTVSSSVEKVQAKQTSINGLYHFLLRQGPIGKAILMVAICLVEWMKIYLPQVTRGIVWLSNSIAPESLKRRMAPRRLGSSPSSEKLSRRELGRLPVRGKQRKELRKRADLAALATLQRIGDIEHAKYRYVSQDFMRIYGLDGESVSPAIDAAAAVRTTTEEEDESDIDWVVKGILDNKSKKKLNDKQALEATLESSSMGGSLSVGVNFDLKSSSPSKSVSKRLQSKSLVQAAMKKDQLKKPAGPLSSDRDGGSGVMGRIRAVTGANSIVSRSLLGAYPGDVVPPTEAGSAKGVSDLARRYGYGEWSDDEDDSNDETNKGIFRKRKRRRKTGSNSKKKSARVKQEGERTRKKSSRKPQSEKFSTGKLDSNSFSEAMQTLTEQRRSEFSSPNGADSNSQVKMPKTSYENKKVKEAMHSLNKLQERSRKKRKKRKEE